MPTTLEMPPAVSRSAGTPAPGPAPADGADVAVVRLPIANLRGNVVGYELIVADATTGPAPAVKPRPPRPCSTAPSPTSAWTA